MLLNLTDCGAGRMHHVCNVLTLCKRKKIRSIVHKDERSSITFSKRKSHLRCGVIRIIQIYSLKFSQCQYTYYLQWWRAFLLHSMAGEKLLFSDTGCYLLFHLLWVTQGPLSCNISLWWAVYFVNCYSPYSVIMSYSVLVHYDYSAIEVSANSGL